MHTVVNLYSKESGEISKFLSKFYNKEIKSPKGAFGVALEYDLKWENKYENSIEIADIIGTFIDNSDKYKINMWISLDEGAFLNVSNDNADSIIRYLYERYPY